MRLKPQVDSESIADARPEQRAAGNNLHRSAPLRPRRRRIRLVVVGLGLLLAALAGLVVRHVATDLEASITASTQAAQRELEVGKAALSAANKEHNAGKLNEADAHFMVASAYFESARSQIDRNVLLRVGRHVPVLAGYVNQRTTAVDNISEMGIKLAHAAVIIARVDRSLIEPPAGTSGSARIMAVLRTSPPDLVGVVSDLSAAQKASAAINADVLSSGQRATLTKTRKTIDDALAAAQEFQRLAPALVDILGGNGPRTYLVEQVNPSELRAGGGFIGTISIVTINAGTMKLGFSGSTYVFDGPRPNKGQPGYYPPPSVLAGFYNRMSWNLEDSNFSADFQTNAKWGQFFAQRVRGTHTDGVISLDYYAVASMLEVTGPIRVPNYGVTFDSKNFIPEVIKLDIAASPVHKTILAATGAELLGRIAQLPADKWPALIQVLNAAVSDRHLQLSFNAPVAQKEMARGGWASALNPQNAHDFMLETEDNFGGVKSNYFLTRHYTVDLSQVGSSLHHHVVIDFAQQGPPRDTPFYSAYARFYVPDVATNLTMRSAPSSEYRPLHGSPGGYVNQDIPTGFKMADGWFVINIGGALSGRYQLVIDYDTPWSSDAEGKHVIYWQKQPGTLNDSVTVLWHVSGRSYEAKGDLNQDRLITLSPTGAILSQAQIASVHLPGIGL